MHQRTRFLGTLLYAATAQDGRCIVIITLRADFSPRCAAYPDLATMLAAHQVLLGPLTDQGLRAVIVEPARRLGAEFEAGLVDRILNVVDKEAGAAGTLVWDADTLELTHAIPTDSDQSEAFGAVAFSPNSTMLATSDASGYVGIVALPNGDQIAFSGAFFSSTVLATAFSPDGHHLALGKFKGNVSIIDVANGAVIGQPFQVSDEFVLATAFNQAATELVIAGENGLVLLDLERRVLIGEPQHPGKKLGPACYRDRPQPGRGTRRSWRPRRRDRHPGHHTRTTGRRRLRHHPGPDGSGDLGLLPG